MVLPAVDVKGPLSDNNSNNLNKFWCAAMLKSSLSFAFENAKCVDDNACLPDPVEYEYFTNM